ncbi:MAG: hypothetical protein K8R21_03900, partial [Leptospira sp.]|nr:hypothetical protein [Leptospira sp.]
MKKFFLTLLLLLFAFCNPGRIEKSQSIELSGEDWYINFNDNPLFSSSDFSHQGWETARVPGNLRLAGKSHRGTFWIRRTVELDPESFTSSMALQFGKVFEKDEVFFNGNLIGINGKKPGDAKQNDFAFGRPRVYPIPHDLLRKGANTIAVRINSEFRNIAGVTTGPVGIVSVKDANEHILNEAIDDIEFIAFYFFVGIFFLINFFKMKEMKEYFSFSIFTIVFAFYLLFKNEFRFEILNTFLVFKYLEYLLLFTLPYLYLLFFQDFFTLEKIRYQNFYLLANLFFALLFVVFRNPIFWNNFISIWSIHILLILGYSAMITYRKILEKNKEGFLYAGALLYFSYAIIKEILIERGIIDGSSALERAYLVFMFFMTAALRFRFILLKLKIQNRFEQLKEVDSLRENIF